MQQVLIVDDDVELCGLLEEYLRAEGFAVELVHDGTKGLQRAASGKHAIVVLDIMLPGMLGLDVLRTLRAKHAIPVILLTARGEDVDRIVGLEIGADDYVPKPVHPRELVARIRAVLRRSQAGGQGTPAGTTSKRLRVGDVVLDPGTRAVTCGNEAVELTAVEFNVLEVLLRTAGNVVSREDLVQEALGRSLSPYDRSIDMLISKIRKKLSRHMGDSDPIKTIRSVGYMFAMPAAREERVR